MKRLTLIIAFAISLPLFSQAQEPAVEVGDQFVNLGIGLGSVTFRGSGYSTVIPPLSVSYEKIVLDQILEKGFIGVGAYLGFSSYKWSYVGINWEYTYTTIIPGVRGAFHYPVIDNLDTYTGLLLGYQIVSAKETGTSVFGAYNATTSGIAWSWYVGGRYFISDNFAIMAELGYGITYLNLGVALKLP